ncbi:flagellar type III secretion system pore protein FliP [Variovorax sp. 770b2]|uniref:flagellar type III secretion system pore protein FliP n=1 Tax=Variovorax sp. 770b2 TaxID=1566271 RepID=UPI0008DF1A41|nr:flagellar type III secretion system pore protein FliP [Variovorax sp. 770b2]SFQ11215.1 flagellar biosynthetic protein FliP [Variovorax sp. 770b2]
MKRSWRTILAPMLLAFALFGLPVDDARSQSQDDAASEVVPGSPTLEAPPAPPAPPVATPPSSPAIVAPGAAPLAATPAAAAPPAAAPSVSTSEPKAAPTAAANPVRSRATPAAAATPTPTPSTTPATETAQALRVVLGLTVLAILPALLVCLTSFLRIIVVLSMLRHAIGMNETPPNTVLIGLALFLTLFTMSPVLQKVNHDAFEPFMAGKLSMEEGYGKGITPLREFMVRQTREADLALMVELSKAPSPKSMDDISNVQLIPSFMLSELRAAFQIGFVIFLPFLLIDLIVSSILMALGMMMMPPTTIALPLKVLMFILVDGWSLVLKALVGSFH